MGRNSGGAALQHKSGYTFVAKLPKRVVIWAKMQLVGRKHSSNLYMQILKIS